MASTATHQAPRNLLEANEQPTIYAMTVVFSIVDTLAVILRFVSRTIDAVRRVLVDTLIIASWVFTMSFNFLALAEVRSGDVEEYLPEAEPNALESFRKIIIGLNIIYLISVVLPRLAILNMYLWLFAHQRVINITAAVVVVNCIGSIITGFFICIPLEIHLKSSINGNCFDMGAWYRWIRLVNVLTDIVILAVPLSHIVKLQASTRVKMGLIATFILGSLGFIAAIITWVEYLGIDIMTDSTWTGTTPLIWHITGVAIYFLAACLLSY